MHYCSTGIDTSVFPVNYANARQQWLSTLAGTSARQHRYACAGHGPHGETLSTDTGWLGPVDARSVLVVLAGTHGIEGFTGSAIQIDLLKHWTDDVLPDNTALLLVHALTPWGYAWLRRCDAEGVDLNRNAVDFSSPLPDNPAYDRLRPALFDVDAKQRQQVFSDFIQRHGRTALEQAVSGGQYHDPAGPFYGGQAPAHGRRVCEDLIARHDLQSRQLAVIDLHTGLGPYGYGEIICDHDLNSTGSTTAQRWYGDAMTLPLAGTSSSVPKLGLLDYLWHAVMGNNSCYITLEFGTYSTDHLFEVLLRDHQLWSEPDNEMARDTHSRAMRRHFCPDDPAWRELVLFRARQVITQALLGVSA